MKKDWKRICEVIVKDCNLDIRYNSLLKNVEIRTNAKTIDPVMIEKANQYLSAFAKGFDLKDAEAFLKIQDLYIDSFDIQDVKLSLQGDHLSRAIGRIAGSGGKVKHTIENATKTRILVCGKTIHIMGTPQSVRLARDAICDLILGADPAKVYQRLRGIASRFTSSQ